MKYLELLVKLVSDVFTNYLAYLKGKDDQRKDTQIEHLESEVKSSERLRNVQTTTDRDVAVNRMRRIGKLRDDEDKPL